MIKIILLFAISLSSANAITLKQEIPSDLLFDLTAVAPTNAGDYFKNSYTQNKTLLTIDNIPNDTQWRIYAKIRQEISGIKIKVKRKSEGTGVNPLEGKKKYKTLKTTFTLTPLFSGKGSHFDILMRTQINGIGVNDGHGAFDTSIIYKVETY